MRRELRRYASSHCRTYTTVIDLISVLFGKAAEKAVNLLTVTLSNNVLVPGDDVIHKTWLPCFEPEKAC